jgi:hypothetical protein
LLAGQIEADLLEISKLEFAFKELRDELCDFNDHVMIFCDTELIGGAKEFLNWASQEYNFVDFRNEDLYETLRREEYALHLQSTKVNGSLSWSIIITRS